jgi:hypothetical protein
MREGSCLLTLHVNMYRRDANNNEISTKTCNEKCISVKALL